MPDPDVGCMIVAWAHNHHADWVMWTVYDDLPANVCDIMRRSLGGVAATAHHAWFELTHFVVWR